MVNSAANTSTTPSANPSGALFRPNFPGHVPKATYCYSKLHSVSNDHNMSSDPLGTRALKALVVSENRYRRLFETAQDGILLLNAETGQIEDVNPYLINLLSYSHAEFLGKKLWEVGPCTDIALSKELFAELQTKGYVRYEDLPLSTSSGAQIAVEFVSNTYECQGVKVIQCNVRDITERKRLENALRLLAFHDPLTRLPNRRLLLDRLEQAMHASKRQNSHVAVLYLDLDKFKVLNDSHGHDAGDLLLIKVAQRLQQAVREADSVARLGGDEFVVLLEGLGDDAEQASAYAISIADKIHLALSTDYVLGDVHYRGSCSIGIRMFLGEVRDAEHILREADLAMYEEKRSAA
jgi:diguanylate cyclase (GGDEF)-like protein/PAS domain S-box-containing protein